MIPIWDKKTGLVFIDSFDLGVIQTIGRGLNLRSDKTDPDLPCFVVDIPGSTAGTVHIIFGDPDVVFVKKKFPSIIIERSDFSPALERYMGVGQLEYKAGVSGTEAVVNGVSGFWDYETKFQATPYNFTYKITCFDLYERNAHAILLKVLKAFPPTGKLFVRDSLNLERTYEANVEGGVTPSHEIVDASRRVKGYSIDIVVQGEIDLVDTTTTSSVSGVDLNIYRMY